MNAKDEISRMSDDALARSQGFTHCVLSCMKGNDPSKPWRKSYCRNLKEAKQLEKWYKEGGHRALHCCLNAPIPRG